MSYHVYIEFVHAYFCSRQVRIPGSARKLSTIYVRGYVYVWRIKISHKRHTFICHVKIYAPSAVYTNLINLIHASKQSACKQTHRKFAAVTCVACCNLNIFLRNKMLSRSYLIYLTKTFGSINKIFGRVKKTIQAKTLVNSSQPVWSTEQKFGCLNQKVL